jgi:hypothetical protein
MLSWEAHQAANSKGAAWDGIPVPLSDCDWPQGQHIATLQRNHKAFDNYDS